MPVLSTLGAAIANVYGFTSGLIKDQYFNLVSLLLPGNGTNGAQNNTFLDSGTANSGSGFTITRNGNTTQGTFSPFSQTGWGNYFDGSSYLANTSTTSVVAPGTSNFTAEFWVYATTDQQSQTYGTVLHVGSGTSGAWQVSLLYSSAGAMKIRVGTAAADYDSTSTISTNRWYHIAIVREGTGSNQTKTYVDGSLFHTFTLSDNLSNSSGLYIGATAFGLTVRRLSGYVSNIRLTNGTALYTGAFTPSTTPLTTTSQGATATQVELLACQSNRFLDNSSNGWVFTTSGSPSVTPFSPFAPTQAYSAAAVGGSGYFDGTGDYLSLTDEAAYDFGAGDFSIDFWYYPISAKAYASVYNRDSVDYPLCIYSGTGVSPAWPECIFAAGTASSWFVTGLATSGVRQNSWNHIAFTRVGSTWRAFTNGVLSTVVTASGTIASGGTPWIGKNGTGAGVSELSMYLCGFRMVKGGVPTLFSTSSTTTGTSIFTPPSQPVTNSESLTAGSLSLLLNFTNAGVVDATAKNVLETVGNAQISTTQSKWGGGSMRFPQSSTNDYLYRPYDPLLNQLNGNFTIECWIYPTTSGVQQIIAGSLSSGGSANWLFQVTSANKLSFSWINTTPTSFDATSTASISTNTWTYVAAVKNGGTITLYINGSADGTASPTGTYRNASFGFGIGRGGDYNGGYFTGYIDDFRMTIGQARTITASPSAPFALQ